MFSPWARDFIRIASVDSAVKWVPGGDNLVKGVQCYELFGGIALKIHTFSFSFSKTKFRFYSLSYTLSHNVFKMLAFQLQTWGKRISDINECRINNTCQPSSYVGIILNNLNFEQKWVHTSLVIGGGNFNGAFQVKTNMSMNQWESH